MWGLRRRREDDGDAEIRERFERVVGRRPQPSHASAARLSDLVPSGPAEASGPSAEALAAASSEAAREVVSAPSGEVPREVVSGRSAEAAREVVSAPSGEVPRDVPAPDAAARALAAFDPGRRGVRALAAVAVVVLAVAGYLAWRARPAPSPVAPRVPAEVTADLPAGPSTAGTLVVAVSGKVHRPGLVRLPVGARVQDAIAAAGGPLPGVDLSYVNLARKLVDGELLLVGVAAPPGSGEAGGAADGGAAGGLINLNTATSAQLQELPGVGPVLAQRIIDHRTRKGGFRAVTDLRQVDGIGDTRYAQLKDLVTV